MIEVSGIAKRFGSHVALEDVSLSVENGMVYGLVGYNGTKGSVTWDQYGTPTLGAILYGDTFVGGLAGYNDGNAAITNTSGKTLIIRGQIVADGDAVGGLIGLNFCTPFLREGWKPGSLPAGGTMEEMLAQLRYLIQVGGEDCIALGSDFDGIEETPEEIPSCLAMPRLAEAMEQNGFTHTEVEKVFSENVRRFLKENL